MTDNTETLPPHPSHATVRDWMPVSEALRLADLWTVGDLDNSAQWRAAIKVLADETRAAIAQRQQVPDGWRDALMAASIALRQLSERAKQVKAALDADLPDGAPVHPQSGALTWPISTALLAIDKIEAALTAAPQAAQAQPQEPPRSAPLTEELRRLAAVALRESEGEPIVQDWMAAALAVCRGISTHEEQR